MTGSRREPRFVEFTALLNKDGIITIIARDGAGQLWWKALHGEAWVLVGMERQVKAASPA